MNAKRAFAILTCIVFFVPAQSFADAKSAEEAKIKITRAGDLFVAGGNVIVGERVLGDAYIAGGEIALGQNVAGDAFLAAGTATVTGSVADSVYAAAGTLNIQGEIGRHLRAAGGEVIVAPGARIGSEATIAGGKVRIDGSVGDFLTVAAGTVRINGRIGGGADITARNLEIGPSAEIAGKLNYRSAQEATVDPGAKLAGGVAHEAWKMPESAGTAAIVALAIGKVFLLAGLMLLGSLLLLVFPNFISAVTNTIATKPGQSLVLGFALLVCLPLLALLLIVTVLGIPLGLTVLFLYPLVLMVGYVTAAAFIGDRGVSFLRKGQTSSVPARIVGLIAALLALAVLQTVPVVGSIALFILLLLGLGAWVIAFYQRYRAPKTAV